MHGQRQPPNKKRKAHRRCKGNFANEKAKQATKKAAKQALLQDAEAPAPDGKAAEEKYLRKEVEAPTSSQEGSTPDTTEDLPKEAEASASGDKVSRY
ncbi:hypothetical protein N7537_012039 [Penicillium hordei]|uniref:Uncharacterized protein n=1 Tax=Penicillium hordei TaxID=40994 RepID=A0AAD6DMZ0_9EURO|nr:uncharacterized protein N7537_012039 [Penicillium hordei]KAJ5589361.1 hypothetical protein N7537_012039 [Penicillium hordei]